MGPYQAMRKLLINLGSSPRKPPLLLWSDRPYSTTRSFFDSRDREWETIGDRIVCACCGRSDSWGWRPVFNPEQMYRCKRCVSLTYTDWES